MYDIMTRSQQLVDFPGRAHPVGMPKWLAIGLQEKSATHHIYMLKYILFKIKNALVDKLKEMGGGGNKISFRFSQQMSLLASNYPSKLCAWNDNDRLIHERSLEKANQNSYRIFYDNQLLVASNATLCLSRDRK